MRCDAMRCGQRFQRINASPQQVGFIGIIMECVYFYAVILSVNKQKLLKRKGLPA